MPFALSIILFNSEFIVLSIFSLLDSKSGIKRVTLSGGVACNSYLRERFGNSKDFECYLPALKYTTDNAAMVAGLAYHMKDKQDFADYNLDCFSRVLNKKYNKNKSAK